MKKRSVILGLFALVIGQTTVVGQPVQDQMQLPLDREVRVGRLSNGMSYYIRHFENPQDRADFYIAHNVGALQEEDNQNGLAHFLEHLAFSGTKNLPNGEMLRYLSSVGVSFGYDVNAYTSQERTVYNISNVPVHREAILDSVLLMIHDWSGSILCDQPQIDAERGIIREEWRRGGDVRARIAQKTDAYVFKGSKYAKRDVIGDTTIINNFTREVLLDFYHKWYRSDLQAVIVVGDFDVNKMEQKIKALFSKIPTVKNPSPKEVVTIPENQTPLVGQICDPDIVSPSLKYIVKMPCPTVAQRGTVFGLKYPFMQDIFTEMLSNRFGSFVDQEDERFEIVVAVKNPISTLHNGLYITATPNKNGTLMTLFDGVATELERMRRYGFTEDEFEQARSSIQKFITRDINRMKSMKSSDLVAQYVEHFTCATPYLTPADFERISMEAFQSITLKDINDRMGEFLPQKNQVVLFSASLSEQTQLPQEETVLAHFAAIQAQQLEPLATDGSSKKPFFAEKLSGGKVVSTRQIPNGNAVEWTLSNGVRVVWKQLASQENVVGINLFSEGGYSCMADSDFLAARLLGDYMRYAGLGELTKSELQRHLACSNLFLPLNVNMYSEGMRGSSPCVDYERMLQLIYLNLVRPRFDASVLDKMKTRMLEDLDKSATSESAKYDKALSEVKFGEHPWAVRRDRHSIEALTINQFEQVHKARFGDASDFTVIFASSMSAEEGKALVEKYIGSLPANGKKEKACDRGFRLVGGVKDFKYIQHDCVLEKSVLSREYHGTIAYTPENLVALNMARYILAMRYQKSIREERSGTYYVSVKCETSFFPRPSAHILVDFETEPRLADELLPEVEKGMVSLVTDGPTVQEVEESRTFLEKMRTQRREDAYYWMDRLYEYYITGVDSDGREAEILQAITPAQIQALLKSIYEQQNVLTVINEQQTK